MIVKVATSVEVPKDSPDHPLYRYLDPTVEDPSEGGELEILVSCWVTAGQKARTYGPPEDCCEGVPAEADFQGATIEGKMADDAAMRYIAETMEDAIKEAAVELAAEASEEPEPPDRDWYESGMFPWPR